jgi:lipid A 3-O-deacylase
MDRLRDLQRFRTDRRHCYGHLSDTSTIGGPLSYVRDAVARVTVLRIGMVLLAVAAAAAPRQARADMNDRLNILEENDSIYFKSDRHYTQGLRASLLGPDVGTESSWNGPFNLFGDLAPVFGSADRRSRRYSVFLGQSIFTPSNLQLKPPDPHDRPYGGWLYVGTSLLQESDRHVLENFELDLGVVGPGALGKQTQNDFHQLIGVKQAQGWSNQIQNEPGGMLSYDRLWRFALLGDGNNGIDIVPQAGVTLGNVFTYAQAGGMLRVGKNLHADYGPVRIRPALSGTDYFDADQLDGDLGFYFFVGGQGRAVAHNIFLDGNTFRQSPGVRKRVLVGDLEAGLSVFRSSNWRLDFAAVRRTKEFFGQQADDLVGTGALSVSW